MKAIHHHRLTVGTASIVSLLMLIALLALWGGGMTFLLLFGDPLSQRLIVQNSEMQDAYEQRLQAFRAEIARLTFESELSRVDQNSVEGKVSDLIRRQRQIESRLKILSRLSELAAIGSSGDVPPSPPSTAPAPVLKPTAPAKNEKSGFHLFQVPSDRSEAAIVRHPYHVAMLETGPSIDLSDEAPSPMMEAYIGRLDEAIARSEQGIFAVSTALSGLSEQRIDRFRAALDQIGLSPQSVTSRQIRSEGKLPSLVLSLSEEGTPFGIAADKVYQNFVLLHKIRAFMSALPLIKPTLNELRYTSPFGIRLHPLKGILKLHAGIDIAAPIGAPVRSSGSGVVASAGWGGGYGNLIQIDHGNGLVSRYAHLSAIEVAAGQPVAAGATIGKIGTTGASTGPHLHFETRIDGAPNNPACFIHAGDKIAGTNTIPLACDKRPVWGNHTQEEEEDDDS